MSHRDILEIEFAYQFMKLKPLQSVIIIKLPKLKSACSLEIQYTHAKPSVSNCDKFFSAFDNLCELCLIGTSFPNFFNNFKFKFYK